MTTLQHQLPLEILLVIATERTDDVDTLRAWSIVSTPFRDPCQQLLFRSITLELGEDYKSIYSRLHDIILSNSKIGSYVKTLNLFFYDDREAAPCFAGLVDLLPDIRKLTLDDGYGSSDGTWDHFSDSITDPVLYLMSRPQLQSLCIGFVDIPLDLLSVLPQLKHLELTTNWGFRKQVHLISSDHSPPKRGYLETLSVRDTQECNLILRALQNPSSALSISRLTRFVGSICNDEEIPWFMSILDLTSETLTSLLITLQIAVWMRRHRQLSLYQLTHLRSLELRTFPNRTARTILGALCILKSLPPLNVVEEVSIVGDIFGFIEEKCVYFDELLGDKRYMPALRQVNMSYPGATIADTGRLTKLSSLGYLTLKNRRIDWGPDI